MADTTIVVYGIRREISENDVDSLETKSHPIQIDARRVGLDIYWGNFAFPMEKNLLFVGKIIGKIGIENNSDVCINTDNLLAIDIAISRAFQVAGIHDLPSLHIVYQPDN